MERNQVKTIGPPLLLDFIRVDMGRRVIDVTKIMTNEDKGPLVFGS